VRAEAAEPEDGETTGREEAQAKTHDRIVGGAASTPVEQQ
jgi:hypothetical protein